METEPAPENVMFSVTDQQEWNHILQTPKTLRSNFIPVFLFGFASCVILELT